MHAVSHVCSKNRKQKAIYVKDFIIFISYIYKMKLHNVYENRTGTTWFVNSLYFQ